MVGIFMVANSAVHMPLIYLLVIRKLAKDEFLGQRESDPESDPHENGPKSGDGGKESI